MTEKVKKLNKNFEGRYPCKFCADQDGFTLIEMMIAMAITLLVMSGVYQVFTSQQKAYSIQDQVAEMQQNVRVAMDMMTRNIRMAGYIAEEWTGGTAPSTDVSDNPPNIGDGTAEDIEEIGANAITFEADIDGDNQTDTVRYSFTGGNLVREVWAWDGATWCCGSGEQPLAENITALSFAYFDSTGAVTVIRADIRLIQISVTARTTREDSGYTHPTKDDGYRRRTLTANVRPRNLGL